jgi:hypothetical protein
MGSRQLQIAGILVMSTVAMGWFGSTAAMADRADRTGTTAENNAQQERLMQRYERMIAFNLDNAHTLPSALVDSLMAQFRDLPLGDRIAAWADYFWRRGDARYLFGLAEGGYAVEGRLVDDFATDCILFFYRTLELGRSSSALEAVQFAYGTRFYGAALETVVSPEGRLDYDNPVHLDYTLDIIRSQIWGKDVTRSLGSAVRDRTGTARYDPDSVQVYYLPRDALAPAAMRNGDVVFFVSDESTESGRRLREQGVIIAHVGIIRIENGIPQLIHPASKGLEGIYAGGKVEKLPLATYLQRVENFKGIMVTRVESF